MRYFFLLVVCFLLAACCQSQKGIGDTFALAIFGTPDVEITPAQVRAIPYASMYAKVNDGSQIFVVLAYAEQGNLKWATRDQAMLVTRNGRLIKTLGLPDNLLEVTNLDTDPLIHPNRILNGTEWTSTRSWTEKGQLRAATFVSRFSLADNETLTILNVPRATRVLEEDVTIVELKTHYRNRYWVDARSGAVIKTEQSIGPDYFPIETTTLTPYKP
ncbi:YjbF family lipoprotein [Candidatus Sodalis pierantonius]|uniref:YjbF family lipoprotein n=1 Tax=Candidatus Sodalis pierantonii TaxID=1486991 RepID=UPI00046D1E14|nr:YjbF family lipoprotein [Candidatus Sodalis pierantonius]